MISSVRPSALPTSRTALRGAWDVLRKAAAVAAAAVSARTAAAAAPKPEPAMAPREVSGK